MSETLTDQKKHLSRDVAIKTEQVLPECHNDVDAADEHGGPQGLEPTRYGDWEKRGRCIDF